MRRLILGSLIGFTVLVFQNCSEPKLSFDYDDYASALGIGLNIVANPSNVKEIEKIQEYTVEIDLPEFGKITSEKISVDGVDQSYTKNALGNLEFAFTPAVNRDYEIKAEVWTPNGTRFEALEILTIKDELAPLVTVTPSTKNIYENKLGAKQEFSFLVKDLGGGFITELQCIFGHEENSEVKYVSSPCNFDFDKGTGFTSNPALIAGNHTLTVRVTDNSGNSHDEVANFSVGPDTLAPSLKVQALAANTYFTIDTQRYTITALDLGSGLASVSCELTSPAGVKTTPVCFNSPVQNAQTLEIKNLTTGNYILTVTAIDKETTKPNKKVVSVTIPLKDDKVEPAILLTKNPANSNLINEKQKVGFKISDLESGLKLNTLVCKIANVAVPCSVDAKGIGEIAFTKTTPAAYPVSVQVNDRYDNVGTNSVVLDIIKDIYAPEITILGNASNPAVPVVGNTLKFDFTIKKTGNLTPITSVVCKNDLSATVPCTLASDKKSGSFSVNFTSAGQKNISVTATDGAGNVSVKTYSLLIKTIVPKILNLTVNGAMKLDVLIVIDDSGSMSEEQKNMADRIDSFVEKLKDTDWRAAVVTTDVTSTTNQGRFRMMADTTKYFITAAEPNAQDILGKTVQGAGIRGSGAEQGIAASYYAIINSGIAPNSGFFRKDAGLSIIVISDEDESAAITANSGDNLIATIKNTWQNKAFKFHSLVGTGAGCPSSILGSKYIELSRKTSGEVACVGQNDYGATLAKIGASTLELVKSTSLACIPVDNKLTIYKDGKQVSVNYKVAGTLVTFDTALPPGTYKMDYKCIQ